MSSIENSLNNLSLSQIRELAREINKVIIIKTPSTKGKKALIKLIMEIHNNYDVGGLDLLGHSGDDAYIIVPRVNVEQTKKQKESKDSREFNKRVDNLIKDMEENTKYEMDKLRNEINKLRGLDEKTKI
mgnify:CR=1 FL=1|tara:strand:- start:623 stop:1009 length:387 start_codon:yes stop_codon:yes gene_type:complete